MSAARLFIALVVAALATGCAQIPRDPLVHQPMTAVADAQAAARGRTNNGGIYPAYGRGNGLFEDNRPRNVGDILTIVIAERMNATKSSGANASRDGSTGAEFTVVPKVIGGLLNNQSADLSGKTAFTGKGGASAGNTFSGNITVTVVDVMPNGNLLVSGEKQMLINQGTEFIRFSGVVNPRQVSGSNTVQSTQVADARIEYSGKGFIDEAQNMGWLQRIFLNVMPY